ncbi:MAG TPA: xanthine dehydrogenase family protein molybdopterin-binding subunit [Thermomicrobiales bacterium]|nr:xanthine dehydrogenase family protein molybdopterin-binding subunit [Thermomicrobiales bacterium]
MVRSAMIGARVRRKEDPRLITGSSMYVDDLQMAGMLHLVFVRSPYAHARIRSIDTSAAASAPGVVAIYTSEQLAEFCGPMPGGAGGEGAPMEEDTPPVEGQSGETAGEVNVTEDSEIPTPTTWPLARGKARWVGEPVVAIVAQTVAQGNDAAELVEIDYEELPAVVDIEAGQEPGSALVWDNIRNNVGVRYERARGDADKAFAEATHTIKQRIRSQRVMPTPMEGRVTAAAPDPLTNGLIVWASNQAPHWVRRDIAAQLGLNESSVRVIAPEVGGGFGAKIPVYREDLATAAIANKLRRPVKWTETRSENFAAMSHGRCQLAEIELAADADGKITGLRLDVTGDAGAYPAGLDMPPITTMMSVGCYAIPNVDLKARAVYTNTSAIGAYRGAGRPEAAYYIERAVDILAHKMGKDPAEVRRLNFIQPDQFPYKSPAGFTYDTGEYEKALDKALEVSNYQQLRAEQEQARQQGRLVGIGLASYVEICGFGPWESSSIRVDPRGAGSIFTGISPHGQGQETTFAQMIADELGADYDRIVVHHGDTGNTPQGNGTMGSRGLAVGGAAVMASAVKIRDKMLAIAGHSLEVSKDDIEYDRASGSYRVKGSPDRSLTFNEIAATAYAGGPPAEIDAGLVTTDFFSTTGETYPFGTHIAQVEIDPETGKVQVQHFWSVDDCGNVISPILVEGQVHGGLAQGIGQALYEETVYDDDGQLITSTLMEYAVPHADSFPMFELHRTVTTTPLNPMGAKGIGEAATIGSTPAMVNAVHDALAPKGITPLDMPLSAPKIWAALQGASS